MWIWGMRSTASSHVGIGELKYEIDMRRRADANCFFQFRLCWNGAKWKHNSWAKECSAQMVAGFAPTKYSDIWSHSWWHQFPLKNKWPTPMLCTAHLDCIWLLWLAACVVNQLHVLVAKACWIISRKSCTLRIQLQPASQLSGARNQLST